MTEGREEGGETNRSPDRQRVLPNVEKGKEILPVADEPTPARRDLPPKAYYAMLFVFAAISLWIRTGFPVHVLADGAYDDLLFVRLADYLKSGDWLGPYDELTLAKGMFYPLFIAVAHLLHMPLKIAEQLVYLAACAASAGLVRRQAKNNYLGLVLFAALAFNPVFWHADLARVIREGLYVSLSLIVVVLVVTIAFPTPGAPAASLLRKVLQGFALGFLGAAFCLTREESIWLAPAVAVVIVIAIVRIPRFGWSSEFTGTIFPGGFARLKAIALPLALASIVLVASVCLVATLNYRHYGVLEITQFRTKSFLHAYGALTRIEHNEWHRYVPFPKDARQRAYAVSPAARELAGTLEGPTAEEWRRISCSTVHVMPCPDEVLAGWFGWEFVEAVRDAGHYHSARESMNFYDTLAQQIDSACNDGRLKCLPPRVSSLPPFRWEYVEETVKSSGAVAKQVFTLGGWHVGSAPSVGSPEGIAFFADMVGAVSPPADVIRSVRGWATAIGMPPNIQLLTNDARCQFSISTLPAPDVSAAYPGLSAMRFDMEAQGCPIVAGAIRVEEAWGNQTLIPFAALVPGSVVDTPSLRFWVESASRGDSAKSADPVQVKVASVVAAGYAVVFPALTIFSAGLLLAILFRGSHAFPSALLAISLASAVAVGTRIVLLAYIDACAFPAASALYSSPASPFVIILAIVGTYLGCAVLLSANRPRPSAERGQ